MPANIPGSLKNNSAITITSKGGPRPAFNRVIRPGMNKISRPMLPGQKIADIRNRLGDMRGYPMRPKLPMQGRMLRPNLPGSLSITKIPRDVRRPGNTNNGPAKVVEAEILDSDDEDVSETSEKKEADKTKDNKSKEEDSPKEANKAKTEKGEDEKVTEIPKNQDAEKVRTPEKEVTNVEETKPIVLTTDEKIPTEEALETKQSESTTKTEETPPSSQTSLSNEPMNLTSRTSSKINLLKNYRHQRPINRPPTESSLSQLERTASSLNKEGLPDFRKNLDDITQSYSPGSEEKSSSSRKKKSPNKIDVADSQNERQTNSMSHSVSSLLSNTQKPRMDHGMQSPAAQSRLPNPNLPMPQDPHLPYNMAKPQPLPNAGHSGMMPPAGGNDGESVGNAVMSGPPNVMSPNAMPVPGQPYAGNPPPEGAYGQYPGMSSEFDFPRA